jgi:hypothetical protein
VLVALIGAWVEAARQSLRERMAKLEGRVGVRGSCDEWRPGQTVRRRSAPYLYAMAPSELHQVTAPSPGHTSIAVFLGKGERFYVARSAIKGWREHVRERVVRL